MKQTIEAVVGRGFGDEGKGMAVDWLCSRFEESIVVKHNGGGQAGHTVELAGEPEKRFVFHQLSSGSFRRAVTLWADSYYPDLYKIAEEVADFYEVAGFVPKISCDFRTHTVLIDDVLLNMLVESKRGDQRHGSCGMGINEADLRCKAGYGITLWDISQKSHGELVKELKYLRKHYYEKKLKEYGVESFSSEYLELLRDDMVLENAAEKMLQNVKLIQFVNQAEEIASSTHVVFETGQGLLLDAQEEQFWPHVTASKTGLYHPRRILKEVAVSLTEVFYVARTYATRHGAGPFPGECGKENIGKICVDLTNLENPWQGKIRYGKYLSQKDFFASVKKDFCEGQLQNMAGKNAEKCAVLLTHLNETDGVLVTEQGAVTMTELEKYGEELFPHFSLYVSDGHFAENIKKSS